MNWLARTWEVIGTDANGDDWTITAADLGEVCCFVNAFLQEGLTDIRVSRVGGAPPGLNESAAAQSRSGERLGRPLIKP